MCKYKNEHAIIFGRRNYFLLNSLKLSEINIVGFCDESIIQDDVDISCPVIFKSEINTINADYIFVAADNYIDSIDKLNDILENDKIKIEPLVKKKFPDEIKDILLNKSNFIKKILQLLSLNSLLKPFIYKLYRKLSAFDINKFINHKIKKNTILITDINDCHAEIIPGVVKYFLDLNYCVDILITKKKWKNLKGALEKNSKVKVFTIGITKYEKALQSNMIKNYDYIVFASSRIYFEAMERGFRFIPDYLKINSDKEKIILIEHRLDELKDYEKENYKILALPCNLNDKKIKTFNPHYFKKSKIKKKNKKTRFIVAGSNDIKRKNFSLIDLILDNFKNNYDFEIVIIGGEYHRKDKRVRILGKVNFKKLYKQLSRADYILALLDSGIEFHKRYQTSASSGSFQLSYGFCLPILIEENFAYFAGFNEKNAIIYEKGNILSAFKKALEGENYIEMRKNLKNLSGEIYKKSLENLKFCLK